jgi:hypothetical protein
VLLPPGLLIKRKICTRKMPLENQQQIFYNAHHKKPMTKIIVHIGETTIKRQQQKLLQQWML